MSEQLNNIYQLSDWKNAVKMKNELNPKIKIDILELQNNAGYILTVFEELSDKITNILYRIPIECSLQNTWSLSNTEAVDLLNTIGFPCEWISTAVISDTVRAQLQDLESFGWVNIIRLMRPAEVHVIDGTNNRNAALNVVIPNFEYKSWEFLTIGIPTPINELLNSTVSPVEE